MTLEPGSRLGHYVLGPRLGAGGMGEVYRAGDTKLGRDVALKVLPADLARDAERLARFQREARAVAALNHPHIVTIYSVEEAEGVHFFTMELVDGQTLDRSILDGGLSGDRIVRIGVAIADALVAAHDKGIVHRDLKPANVMVTSTGQVKVLDFGLAKVSTDHTQGDAAMVTALQTREGVVMGTVPYMSPEQVAGRAVDHRTDLFSLGVILYEMASGRRPFEGASSIELASAILRDTPPLITDVRGDLPADLARLIRRCLDKDPRQRIQTAREVSDECRDLARLSQTGTVPGPARRSTAGGSVADTAGRTASMTASIAVLPFANMSADKDQDYFSDGLAEEIINLLAHVSGLKVIARTSAFAFRGKEQDIRGIADALGVRAILQGSVRRAGSRIRVSAQLINAADGDHLWSERFDREMTEVFAVQDEIAAAIASALKVTLTGKSVDARPHEPNVAAYEAFLKGRHHYYQFSPEAFARAEEDFARATELDPQWAEPRAALGDLYFALGFYGWRPLDAMIPRARAEARKALELIPSHPMAHAVLGTIAALHDYDWREAEEQFRPARASESLPPNGRMLCALFYLLALGRFDEALQEMAQAIAQDPLNAFWRARQAWVLLCADRHDEAIAEARNALDFDDTNYQARMMIALTLTFQGKLAEAREPAEEVFRVAAYDALNTGLLAGLLARAGEKDRAEHLLATMSGAVTIGMMMYHLVCGEIEAAIDWYQKDIELRRPNAPMIAFAGFLEPLRASPRWPKLASLMNLPLLGPGDGRAPTRRRVDSPPGH